MALLYGKGSFRSCYQKCNRSRCHLSSRSPGMNGLSGMFPTILPRHFQNGRRAGKNQSVPALHSR